MKNDKDKYVFKRGRRNNHREGIGFALLLILVGGVFLLFNLDLISAVYRPILISWQMLLIVMGLWMLIKQNFGGGISLLVIGGFFIYPKLCNVLPDHFICFDFNIGTYWPLILIVVGIALVLGKLFPSKRKWDKWNRYCNDSSNDNWTGSEKAEHNSAEFIDKNLMFGSSEQIVLAQNFRGGEANVMFGELVIDLRRAKLAQGANKLDISVLFGNAIIYVPDDWMVEIQSTTVFGSIEDKRYRPVEFQQEGESKLTLKISVMFGGGEVRS